MADNTRNTAYRAVLSSLRPALWVVAGLSAVISLLMLTGSIYMLQIYDRVLSSGSVPTLLVLFGLVVVLYGFMAVYDGLRMRFLSRLSLQLDARLAEPAFHADLNARRKGEAGNTTNDLEMVRMLLSGPAMLAIFDLPFTVIFVAVLFLIHPMLGVLTLVGMGLAAILALINRMVLRAPTDDAQKLEAPQRQMGEAVFSAAATVMALGMRQSTSKRWLDMHRQKLATLQKGQDPSEMLAASSRALRMLLQAGLLTAAAYLVLQGAISAGAIIAASILSGRALAPVDQLIGQWRQITLGRAAHKRLRTAPLDEPAALPSLPPLTGALEVDKLTRLAATAPGEEADPVLDKVSFKLAPGDGLGIIGASASGKSTLARLIVGAISPDGGRIRFDGATPLQWNTDDLGRQIGYLPQRIDLLPGSVRDNIARFDPEATDESVMLAAREAGVHEMILRLPQGYATQVGSGDVPLSGGQIQRIGLARALYGDPRILVLDEPNAHLDTNGEAALARALRARRKSGATVIVLAHRAGALVAVDRLIVLEEGRISQDGPRDEVLLALQGRPFARQTGAGTHTPIGTPAITIRSLKPSAQPHAQPLQKQEPILLTPSQKVS